MHVKMSSGGCEGLCRPNLPTSGRALAATGQQLAIYEGTDLGKTS